MEKLVIDQKFWEGRKVFLTGHTGFKGGWLCLVLRMLGADVCGFALPPESAYGIFNTAHVADDLKHVIGDVRQLQNLTEAMKDANPTIVIHMAAQPLVRYSYADPVSTYSTNVMGTVNLLEAVRSVPDARAVLVVTSDKCYENVGWLWGYRENDHLGGYDPYSNSKGCAELVISAYRRSFFGYASSPIVSSARAGNVVGGGDWAEDRLVPDAIRAFASGKPLFIRNPDAVRPWQHVLDPIIGYLRLIEQSVNGVDNSFGEAWNFGPAASSEVSVRTVVEHLTKYWGNGAEWRHDKNEDNPHEAAYLKLDCSKSHQRLGWRPVLTLERALQMTVDWYRALQQGSDMRRFSLEQIRKVVNAKL